jgi:hypothetical protein
MLPSPSKTSPTRQPSRRLDELLESTVEGGAEGLDVLVELDRGLAALGNALGCELEFLRCKSAYM